MTKKPLGSRITAIVTAALTMAVMCLPASALAATDGVTSGVTKEETVYVVTDSAGAQTDVIVSDHLVNKNKAKTIADQSNLTEIENVKGEETFKQNGEALTWDAQGNGIYYQGRSEDEIPVTMDIVYRLDGKVVTGSELQGKSGKVEIKINYENNAVYNDTTVPLIVMTGMIITDESFKHIKITKGKVIDDGDKLMVVGMAAPGLAQTLGIGESELGIGSSVTITGDADKFAVEDMMTIVTNAFFDEVDTDEFGDLDYDDEINELDKGARALEDGSDQLYKGLNKMAEKMPDLQEGIGQLKDGSDALADGTNQVHKGAKALADGSKKLGKTLKSQLNEMLNGVTQLANGSAALHDGLVEMKEGVGDKKTDKTLINTADKMQKGMKKASDTVTEYEDKAVAANNGAKKAIGKAEEAIDGADRYINNGADAYINAAIEQIDDLYSNGKLSKLEYAQLTTTLLGPEQLKALHDNGVINDLVYKYMSTEFEKYAMPNGEYGAVPALDEATKLLGSEAGAKKALGVADPEDPDYNKQGKSNAVELINSSTAVANGVSATLKQTLTKKGTSKNPTLYDAIVGISGGLSKLSKGLGDDNTENTLINGSYQLYGGLDKLQSKLSKTLGKKGTLNQGLRKLTKGSSDLADGTDQLAGGASQLANGMTQLNDSTDTMVDGVNQLSDGALKLRKGMSQMYEQGIKKIVDLYNDDLKGTLDSAENMIDAGKGYKTFTRLASGMDGNVKFIYKTDMTR